MPLKSRTIDEVGKQTGGVVLIGGCRYSYLLLLFLLLLPLLLFVYICWLKNVPGTADKFESNLMSSISISSSLDISLSLPLASLCSSSELSFSMLRRAAKSITTSDETSSSSMLEPNKQTERKENAREIQPAYQPFNNTHLLADY